MTEKEFNARVAATAADINGATTMAARMVLVGGKQQVEAAKLLGISRACVSRALKRLNALKVCKHCGRAG